jgi:predicted AlkP superfamily phosphohydrolase/phosphomutase
LKSILFDLGVAPMNVYNLLMRFGLGKLKREVVRGKGQGLLKTLFLSFDDVDWSRTQAYSLGNVGQIHLNVAGREPQGIVEQGEQYESVRNEIMARLWELRDPETGEKVIQEIYRREEVYQGEKLAEAADIVFIPTRMEYFGFGEYEFGSHRVIEGMKHGISGTHRPNGIFLMRGKPLRANTWLEGAQIYDLAPTILHLMGCSVLPDMDGRVLLEALLPEYSRLVVLSADTNQTNSLPLPNSPSQDGELSEEEEETISNRLRNLGYVG